MTTPHDPTDDDLIANMMGTMARMEADRQRWMDAANEAYTVAKQMADRMSNCTCGASHGLIP